MPVAGQPGLRPLGALLAMSTSSALHEKESAKGFNGVFTATTRDELARAYDGWAATYDATVENELAGRGVNEPVVELMAVLKKVVSTCEKVLDVGAGTGAAGPLLSLIHI